MRQRSIARQLLFSLALLVLMLLVAVVVIELAVPRIFGKWWPSINLVGNPDHRMTPTMYDDVNSDGIRSASEPGEFHAGDFNVIVLGDSFVYGMLLGRQDTLPHRLQELAQAAGRPDVRVINFGWISASPYLSQRLLRDIGAKYRPDLVIEVVDMTDFWDDTFYRRAVERRGFFALAHYFPATSLFLGKWGREVIRSDAYSQLLWGVPWQRYFAMERPLAETRPYLDAVVDNLDETHRFVSEVLGVPYAVFVMPRSVQYSATETPEDRSDEYTRLGPFSREPFRYVAEVAPQRPYPLVPLLEDFRQSTVTPLTFEHDPHLSSAGNREAARMILAHLQRLQLLTVPRPVGTTSR